MRWPGMFAPGSKTDQVTLMFDLTASILAAAGITPPRKLDGEDLLAEWRGQKPVKPRTVFWRYRRLQNTRKAVRHGDWKLVNDNGKEELHNIAADPNEKNDQLQTRPAIARDLRLKLAAWEQDVRAPRLKEFHARRG
jgi:arylsulfatase A-like enzyme